MVDRVLVLCKGFSPRISQMNADLAV